MNLVLVRKHGTKGFTEGKLYEKEGESKDFECFTVEDEERPVKIPGGTAIPVGKYSLTISKSERFSKLRGYDVFLIEVLNVPGFSGIRIHSGNSSKDTEGCIIVGSVNSRDDDDWVGGSRIAYNRLHAKVKAALSAGETVTLEVM